MIDDNHQDDKIIAVATNDPFMNNKKELNDINPETLNTIKQFFQDYKKPEKKEVVVQGFMQRDEALKCVQNSIARYKKEFPKI